MTMGTLGLDNIAVALALGPLGLAPRRMLLLGVAFGLTEAGMTLLGASALGQAWLLTADAARAGVLATLAVALIGLAWVKCWPAEIVSNPWALMGMSLLLGIDNLIAGSEPAVSFAPVMTASVLTGALATVACAAGAALFPLTPRRGALVSALLLTGLAVAGIA
jgi:putative Mn2+ efflux pump MntP